MANENTNSLADMHGVFVRIPVLFRERMCEQCNWSMPTFYRKMRQVNDWDKDSSLTSTLSNAEKTMMKMVAIEVKEWLQNCLIQLIEA
ncbi:hypothetical protein HF324_04990 [Chitinophaga oryzae]|uniref:Uncharacterized protein n=1 Tax=Chitinophaga oryzae TaxID=2725414 RepID=A0ABX6LAZ7_9BACT|nr:hypothetical protein [Chitinophaga oryzae]QJB37242.1 hypothetical protein HF324_04990 [Chitinophaga oryzae]